MPAFTRRVFSPLLIICGLALMLRPAAALSSAPAVLINEFMPRPNTGKPEWVELFNPNQMPIDVSGWKIDNSVIGGTQMLFPTGSLIQSNSLLVITRPGDILGISDTVQLLDAGDNPINIYTYSSAITGQTFARTPDGGATWAQGVPSQGDWNSGVEPTPLPTNTPTITPTNTATPTNTSMPTDTATSTTTPTNTPTNMPNPTATPYPTGILINEFLANPKILYSSEWIELYNCTSSYWLHDSRNNSCT